MTFVLAPFLESCEKFPDRIAIIDRDGAAITYRTLRDEATALAGEWRRHGLAPASNVLVAHPVSIALYRALIAIWMAGCGAVFPEPFAGLAGLRHARALLDPEAAVSNGPGRLLLPLLTGGGIRMLSPHPSEFSASTSPAPPSQIALYSFTSGSTAEPKCIPRSHDFMLAQNDAVSRVLASARHETDLVWFPVFVLAILANGGTAVLADSALKRPGRPDTEALVRQIARHGVSRLLAPPAVALALSAHPSVRGLATVFTGGGSVMPHHFEAIGRIADEVVALYGSTEAEPIAVLSSRDISHDDLAAMRGGAGLLAGRPVEPLALRIVADEIQVAGPHVVQAYLDPDHNRENKLEEGGLVWHRTGDGGRLDADGRLWLRGRLKGRVGDLWPLEIEPPILALPEITAAALTEIDGTPILAVASDRMPEIPPYLEALAARAGIARVNRIPMDRRHASKVDYSRLDKIVRQATRGTWQETKVGAGQ